MSKMDKDLFCGEDLISSLRRSGEKIALYGMGNGAAKLIDVLHANSLECDAVFASDGFVRGQDFLGHRVLTLAQTEALLGDFTVLVGFASARPEVISSVKALRKRHKTLIPDINVCGDHLELFDRRFFEENFSRLNRLYDALSDETSRRFLVSLVNFKLSGDPEPLWELDSLSQNRTDELCVRAFADLGAYTGDTLAEQIAEHPELEILVAFEPDKWAFGRLTSAADRFRGSLRKAILVNAAAGDAEKIAVLDGQGRGSGLDTQSVCPGLRNHKPRQVSVKTLDSVVGELSGVCIDLVKFDVEGSERAALAGAVKTLGSHRPAVEMSVYHNRSDLTELFEALKNLYPDADFYLSKKCPCFPAWDVRLTVVPRTAKRKASCS